MKFVLLMVCAFPTAAVGQLFVDPVASDFTTRPAQVAPQGTLDILRAMEHLENAIALQSCLEDGWRFSSRISSERTEQVVLAEIDEFIMAYRSFPDAQGTLPTYAAEMLVPILPWYSHDVATGLLMAQVFSYAASFTESYRRLWQNAEISHDLRRSLDLETVGHLLQCDRRMQQALLPVRPSERPSTSEVVPNQ